MVFRDDGEAARARADALQREVDQLRVENAELASKLAEAELALKSEQARRPKDALVKRPAAEVDPAPRQRAVARTALGALAVGGATALLGTIVSLPALCIAGLVIMGGAVAWAQQPRD